ncbi:apoptosis inhibitor 5-like protein [Leptotrombidium deliense]|uniref:Apoptosis inhibitor 5-like protein n=1 Tax=Leptotrombidium deliense TaxID=299467 RepID=A0A443SJ20_9ACAR|nr:apoptosis inhibitor 5-like protein [Leptotrombidium deliense]
MTTDANNVTITVNVEELYNKYNVLDEAGDKISEHEDAFNYILSGVKGNANEKRLASQFIAKFFKHFPSYYETAIDALLDLCEDEDIIIRKQAIKDLPTICKECKNFVPKITDILAQLLLAEDPNELQLINTSLVTLCKMHPQGFLSGLFSQIECGDDVTRERVIKFLSLKMKTLPEDLFSRDVQEYFLQESRKVMQDCTKDEFTTFMSLLAGLKISKTVSGQQVLIDIITEQAELENPFDPQDIECVDKVLMCIKQAAPYFSPFVPSNAYLQYLCKQMIPNLEKITETFANDSTGIDLQILQTLAELSPFVQPNNVNLAINLEECLSFVFERLLQFMPLPPLSEQIVEKKEEPSFQLSHVECLMYTFHQLIKHNPTFLSNGDNGEERLKDLKLRLQYLAQGVQNYIKKLKESLTTVKTEERKSEEHRLKCAALRTTSNINLLIKDLFKNPPASKVVVNLSWKPVKKMTPHLPQTFSTPVTKTTQAPTATADTENSGTKRKAVTAPEGSKPKKEFRQFYAPPSGKFSSNITTNFQNMQL